MAIRVDLMGLIEINGRLVDDPFEMNRNIARCHDEIALGKGVFSNARTHRAKPQNIG